VGKPDIETAGWYSTSGEYFWNSGIFVFKCSVLWKAIEEFTPHLYDSLKKIDKYIDTPFYNEQIAKLYSAIEAISIDYGIMEKAENIYVVKGSFQLNDLGGWEQVYELSEKDAFGNATVGNVVLKDTENSYIYSKNGLIALMGVKDLLVVQDGNTTLVMKRKGSENIKILVEYLRSNGFKEYI
jgi:mannose-1-phosphate guanylyltransferase